MAIRHVVSGNREKRGQKNMAIWHVVSAYFGDKLDLSYSKHGRGVCFRACFYVNHLQDQTKCYFQARFFENDTAQSFRCAHRGRVCVRVVSVCVVLCHSKKNKLTRGGSEPTFVFSTNGGNRENTRKKKVTERSASEKHDHMTSSFSLFWR
jgi:hypothetical protein